MRYQSRVANRYSEFKFAEKPPEAIRSILKGHGYRWSPASSVWWRPRATGHADVAMAIDHVIHKLSGKPDGQCWDCTSPQGFFRNYGAGTPVYCDACHAKHNKPTSPFIDVDRLYEDDCARQCGV